jgi:hypothetical protein
MQQHPTHGVMLTNLKTVMLCTARPVETRKFFLLKVLFFGGVNLKNIKPKQPHAWSPYYHCS